MYLRTALLLAVLVCAHGLQYDAVAVTGNPHMGPMKSSAMGDEKCAAEQYSSTDSACPVLGVVDASVVLNGPILTQVGTFLKMTHKVYLGQEIPVFHFKQPAELNPGQLPFKIVRVSALHASGMLTIPVSLEMSHNSWFPQYYWSILVCNQCNGNMMHLGWQFTSKADPTDSFLGLIVDFVEGQERERTAADKIMEQLQIGVRAPAWMVAMASVTMLRPVSK